MKLTTCVLPVFLATTAVSGLTLVDGGESEYVIVIPADAIPAEQFAAEELALHLEQISGVRMPTISDTDALPARAILLGKTRFLTNLGVDVDWESFGKEGHLLRVAGDHLIIAGGRPRGTLYGVYALLEDHLGCRWFAPDTSFIPKRATIRLDQLNIAGKPAFEYREPWMYVGHIWSFWWRDHFDADYVSRTRNSGRLIDNTHTHTMDERHGGSFKMPYGGHNLSRLVPAERYAAQYPEYFALYEGRRDTEGDLELCLTHPEVVRLGTETMRQWMRADPDADMFFIGQSDSYKYCQCDRCLAAYERYSVRDVRTMTRPVGHGGLAGRNLQFVNEVAKRLEDEFPDKRIGTFAYHDTLNPPANIKAHRNVVIWYAPIVRCGDHALDRGPINADLYAFMDAIWKWKQIAKEVYLYEYFRSGGVFEPPVDLLNIAPTVRAARRLGIGGIMVDAIPEIHAQFGFLRYWLWCQLLRKPDFDADRGLREFLDAYYGAASRPINEYIRLASNPRMHEPLPAEAIDRVFAHAHGGGNAPYPEADARWELTWRCYGWLWPKPTREAIEQSHRLFEEARQATADDPKSRRHVEAARMALEHNMLEYLPADDPRLKSEAVSLHRIATELQMRTLGGMPADQYWDKIRNKLGLDVIESH